MECVDFEIRWQEMLDQRRRPESDAALVEHARQCQACGNLAQALGLVFDVIENLPTPPAPAGISEQVLVELRRAQVVPWRSARRRSSLVAAAAIVAALSIPLAYWMGRQSTGAQRTAQLSEATQQQPADAFWLNPLADGNLPTADDETRWSQRVQTSLEPLTHSTTAAFDSLWQAIPAATEDPRL